MKRGICLLWMESLSFYPFFLLTKSPFSDDGASALASIRFGGWN